MDDDNLVEIDPEIGVFADPGGLVPNPFPLYERSSRDEIIRRDEIIHRDWQRKKSAACRRRRRQFNLYMIELFNARQK